MTTLPLEAMRDWLIIQLSAMRQQLRLANVAPIVVSEKAPQDFVTSVDELMQDAFVRAVQSEFVDHRVIAEEGASVQVIRSGVTWIVDPLDGTSNFVSDVPFFGISVAMLVDGIVTIAAVQDFVRGEVFDAIRGRGARLNGVPMMCREPSRKSSLVGVSTGVVDLLMQSSPADYQALRRLGRVRVFGAQSLQLCYVAAGRLLANLSVEARLWDDVAGALIVAESGCVYQSISLSDVQVVREIDPMLKLFSVAAEPATYGALYQVMSNIHRFREGV